MEEKSTCMYDEVFMYVLVSLMLLYYCIST